MCLNVFSGLKKNKLQKGLRGRFLMLDFKNRPRVGGQWYREEEELGWVRERPFGRQGLL